MTKTSTARTYGFTVTETTFADLPCVEARVYAREAEAAHPINPRPDGEDTIWDAPKSLDGFMLDDLIVRLWKGDYGWTEPYIEFSGHVSANLRRTRAMLKTLEKVEKAIAKAEAREPGDVLMAMGKALGFSFYAEQHGANRSCWLSDGHWHWGPLSEARDKMRALVAKIDAEAAPKIAA